MVGISLVSGALLDRELASSFVIFYGFSLSTLWVLFKLFLLAFLLVL
jgi:hypothetical protein